MTQPGLLPTPFVKGSWTVVVLPDTQKCTSGDKISAGSPIVTWSA